MLNYTGIISQIKDNDRILSLNVRCFVLVYNDHNLFLNIKTRKEMIIDFRRKSPAHRNLVIANKDEDIFSHFKYLGEMLNN